MPNETNEEERFETEIFRKMTIPKMEVPRHFEPRLREIDIEDLDKRDRKIILANSVLEQKIDFTMHWCRLCNYWQRQLQAQQIRLRSWPYKMLQYTAVAVAAAVLSTLMQELVKWLFR